MPPKHMYSDFAEMGLNQDSNSNLDTAKSESKRRERDSIPIFMQKGGINGFRTIQQYDNASHSKTPKDLNKGTKISVKQSSKVSSSFTAARQVNPYAHTKNYGQKKGV